MAQVARPPSVGLDWLAAALAPGRVDETVTAAFGAEHPAPADLLAATRATLIAARLGTR